MVKEYGGKFAIEEVWSEPNEKRIREEMEALFDKTAQHFDERCDRLKESVAVMVETRLSAAQPEAIRADIERFVAERLDAAFSFSSHEFQRNLTDIVSRIFQSDGRRSRKKVDDLLNEMWRRGK